MNPAVLEDIPRRVILDRFVGGAILRVRWLVGDVVAQATALGQAARDLARRRKAEDRAIAAAARKGEEPPAIRPRLSDIPAALGLLARALTWSSILLGRLYAIRPGGTRPRIGGVRPAPAWARRAPEIAALEAAEAEALAAARQAALEADPAARIALAAARLRARKAREDRIALAAALEAREVPDILAQICADVIGAAEELGAPMVIAAIGRIIREIARVFGIAAAAEGADGPQGAPGTGMAAHPPHGPAPAHRDSG